MAKKLISLELDERVLTRIEALGGDLTANIERLLLESLPAEKLPPLQKVPQAPEKHTQMGFDLGESLTTAEVLARYREGPQNGIFTDGGARPNPGPGGWGVAYVENGKLLKQLYGHSPDTTNNRMELTALINALQMLPNDTRVEIFSDSELCVNTLNQWAASWEKNGWKRKSGPIANLDLVKELYGLKKQHPHVTFKWIKAHNGWLWNEYVDSLSSAWCRKVL